GRNRKCGILGNIYEVKVTKVLPGMQSAFVDIGLEKDAFLYVSDFIEDTEEYDKVFTSAEEQVADVMAEIETQERPQRRERRERPRWRDRKERWDPTRDVTPPAAGNEPAAATLESWFLASETELGGASRLENGLASTASEV